VLLSLACSQFKTVSRADQLSSADQLEYLILTALAPEAGKEFLALPTAQARAEYLAWFWAQPQWGAAGDPTTAHQRYLDRAVQARTFFGQRDLFGDDRVKAYIRFGPPQRAVFAPQTTTTETLTITVSPAEIWTYPALGRQLDFVKQGTAFRLVGTSRFGPGVVAPAFEPVDLGRPAPVPVADARPLELELSLGRLRQQAETVQVELSYGIPARTLLRLTPAGSQPLIHWTIQLVPRTKGTKTIRKFWTGTSAEPDTTLSDYVVGRELFWLPADIYTVTVTAVSADRQAYSRRSAELNLIDYLRRAQPCSDILSYSLIDSTFQSPQFQRPDWQRVVPLVVPAVRSGQTFYVLYELYNLTTDELGRHRAEARYEILERNRRQLAVVPLPDRFITGPGTTAVVVERLHTMNLNPGPYLLIARTKDLVSGRTISLTGQFQILPR